MILVDFSAIMHQMIYGGVMAAKPKKTNGIYNTSEFINVTKNLILGELFSVYSKFIRYGEMVIALDTGSSWRKRVYGSYKSTRKTAREKSEINYQEVFIELNRLIDVLREHTPWKVVDVPEAEGDDVILVLAEENGKKGIPTMIVSADKDMIQAQRYPCIQQYSPTQKKFLTAEQKAEGDLSNDSMQEWLIEHVVLGDTSDEIPRITDGCKFSKEFLEHLESKGLGDLDICEFEDDNVKREFALNGFTVQKVNAKGQELGLKIFDNPKVGVKTIKKEVQKYGSLENWVNTSKILRKHFERNKELILMDYIPKDIKNAIIRSYNESSSEYHEKEFAEYCRSNNLARLLSELPPNFKSSLSVDSLLEGW